MAAKRLRQSAKKPLEQEQTALPGAGLMNFAVGTGDEGLEVLTGLRFTGKSGEPGEIGSPLFPVNRKHVCTERPWATALSA